MKKFKVVIAAALLVAAVGSAWASNNATKRLINNPYYNVGGVWKQLIRNNVPCHAGPADCKQQTPDGLQQLYAAPDFAQPLQHD